MDEVSHKLPTFVFLVEEAYTQQGRAHIRRLHPDWAARPALMSRAAHAVESKAVVRIEVASFFFAMRRSMY
jgi:hypothetical protein